MGDIAFTSSSALLAVLLLFSTVFATPLELEEWMFLLWVMQLCLAGRLLVQVTHNPF